MRRVKVTQPRPVNCIFFFIPPSLFFFFSSTPSPCSGLAWEVGACLESLERIIIKKKKKKGGRISYREFPY